MPVLVTGVAGFIGSHVALDLLGRGEEVIGLDNLNDYYDVSLKEARLSRIEQNENATAFSFVRGDIQDVETLEKLFSEHEITGVIHLAAQAGVRYSIENPRAYIDSNVVGFMNILECCRHHAVDHLVYASSSSVYGSNEKVPYAVEDAVDHPISMYAATKKSNELMAHVYSHLFCLPTTGLRFFTVYGPWGRPDMSAYLFTKAIFEGEPIKLFNHGNHKRDFTFIDDIVDGVIRTFDSPPAADVARYAIYNIGNNNPVNLRDYVEILERLVGRSAHIQLEPMQPGDVEATFADVSALERSFGWSPSTPIELGLERFVDWYREYHGDVATR